MTKLHKIILTIITGLAIAIVVIAFNNPPGNPPTGGGTIGVGANAPSNSIYVKSDGNVGIGTTGPSGKLEVHQGGVGGGFSTPLVRLRDTTISSQAWDIYGSDGGASPVKSFRIADTDTSTGTENWRFVINNNGNVGIGTTAPGAKLQVGSSAAILPGYGTPTIAAIDTAGSMYIGYSNASIIFDAQGASAENRVWSFGASGSNENLKFSLGNNAGTIATPWLQVDRTGTTVDSVLFPNGNVGIGTTNPGATLEVKGTMKVFGAWETKNANTVYQAATDGFIIVPDAYIDPYGNTTKIYTDSSNPPTTERASPSTGSGTTQLRTQLMVPVRKNDYWKIVTTGAVPTIYWIPLGT